MLKERNWPMGFMCSFISHYTFINAVFYEYLGFIHKASAFCLKVKNSVGVGRIGDRSHSDTTLKNSPALHSRKISVLSHYYFLKRQRGKCIIDEKKIAHRLLRWVLKKRNTFLVKYMRKS